MHYNIILTITAAFRLAIAAAIPRYSSTSTTMDDTIAMLAPTVFETKTVTATVTALKELTITVPKDNDVPAPSRHEQSLTIAPPTATPATPATPTQPRQTDAGFPPGPHYSPPELGIHPPLAQITPAPVLIDRARDWRADRDKAISKAREAGARGRKQGQDGRNKGQSAGAAAAAAARRMFDEQDRPVDWQDQIASAMSIASSALAYASSASLAASATVTVTVPSSDDDFYFTDEEGHVFHHHTHHDSSTSTTSPATPTTNSGCGPTQTEDPEGVLASGVEGRQTSHLTSGVITVIALLAAAGVQVL